MSLLVIALGIAACSLLALLAGLAAVLVALTRRSRRVQAAHRDGVTRKIEKLDALQAAGRISAAESAELRQALEDQGAAAEPAGSRRRLSKSSSVVIAGVCGGLAEWLDWDPTLVRLGYVLASLLIAGFPGFLIYIVLAVVMPSGAEAPPARTNRSSQVLLILVLGPLVLAAAVVGCVLLARLAHAV